ncbi:hypothetical protein HNR01_005603 [Methylorubrum rhodesianum]|nr:hypothetical protein [Methylorubrum rhodesianum]
MEEIAYLQGFIGREQLRARGELFAKTKYGQNLLRLAREGRRPDHSFDT